MVEMKAESKPVTTVPGGIFTKQKLGGLSNLVFRLARTRSLDPGLCSLGRLANQKRGGRKQTSEAFVYCPSNASCSRTSPRDAGKLLLRTATRTPCSSPYTLLLHSRLLLADQGARNCEGWKKGWEKGARLAGRGRNPKRIACV